MADPKTPDTEASKPSSDKPVAVTINKDGKEMSVSKATAEFMKKNGWKTGSA